MAQYQQSDQLNPAAFEQEMAKQVRQTLERVAAAVNEAQDGAWIEDSEEQVRDEMAKFRQAAYEKALQMRTDAAEAAFPPSAS